MLELARPGGLRREKLREQDYFESLLEEAYGRGCISREAVERIQTACMALLRRQCGRYTGGQSTSLPREQAEEILSSILFTLGAWLKAYPSPEEALSALEAAPSLEEGLQAGFRRVQIKVRATRQFYRLCQRRMPDTANALYNGTVFGGIPGFFKLYEPRFASHKIHITADYPLLFYPGGYQGIDFIQAYLQRLDYENRFCRAFPLPALKAALTRHAIEYDTIVEDLHANLCAVALEAALACALAGEPILGLALSSGGRERLAHVLAGGGASRLPLALKTVLGEIALHPAAADYLGRAVKLQGGDLASEMRLLV